MRRQPLLSKHLIERSNKIRLSHLRDTCCGQRLWAAAVGSGCELSTVLLRGNPVSFPSLQHPEAAEEDTVTGENADAWHNHRHVWVLNLDQADT